MANGIPLLKNIVSFFGLFFLVVFLLSVNELEGCLRQLAGRGMKEAMIVVQTTKRNQETKIALTKTTAATVMLFSICLSRLLVGSNNTGAIHHRSADADT
jgi:hypothetical protein